MLILQVCYFLGKYNSQQAIVQKKRTMFLALCYPQALQIYPSVLYMG